MNDSLQYTAFVDLMGFADGQESLAMEDAQRLTRVMAGEWLLHPELSDPGRNHLGRGGWPEEAGISCAENQPGGRIP
jgi:hypothetical protein